MSISDWVLSYILNERSIQILRILAQLDKPVTGRTINLIIHKQTGHYIGAATLYTTLDYLLSKKLVYMHPERTWTITEVGIAWLAEYNET